MYILLTLIPATLVAILGYFILYSSTRTAGAVQTLGRILAAWVFVLAAALPAAGAYATYADVPSLGEMMRSMHARVHR